MKRVHFCLLCFLAVYVCNGQSTSVHLPSLAGSIQTLDSLEIIQRRIHRIDDLISSSVGSHSVQVYEERPRIRGGDYAGVQFMVDGFVQSDLLLDTPFLHINLDAVESVQVQTGGFSARYGDLISGLVSVETREGGSNYSGSFDMRYSPPRLKHFGPMMYGFDSPVVEPFVNVWDQQGRWDPGAPSNSGIGDLGYHAYWTEYKPYSDFTPGWYAWAQDENTAGWLYPGPAPSQESLDRAAQELYARYLWRHRSKDAIEELKRLQQEGLVDIEWGKGIEPDEEALFDYGSAPDFRMSATFGGPLPLVNRYTPTTFFLAFDREQIESSYRSAEPTYTDGQFFGKVFSKISDFLEIRIHGYHSKQTGAQRRCSRKDRVFYAPFDVPSENKYWYPSRNYEGEQTYQRYGMDLRHRVSDQISYVLKYAFSSFRNRPIEDFRNTAPLFGAYTSSNGAGIKGGAIGTEAYADSLATAGVLGWNNWRDWAKVKIGDIWYDEAPNGYDPINWRDVTGEYRFGTGVRVDSDTYTRSHQFNIDGSYARSRIINLNFGGQLKRNTIHQVYQQLGGIVREELYSYSSLTADEIKGAAYIENTLKWERFTARIGIRGDGLFQDEFPVLDGVFKDKTRGPFTIYQQAGNTKDEDGSYNTYRVLPTRRIRKIRWSPRLSAIQQVGSIGSVYFNYGHMYRWPNVSDRYILDYHWERISYWGNPRLDPIKRVQFEIGYRKNRLIGWFDIEAVFYNRSMRQIPNYARYYPIAGAGYTSYQNDGYSKTRGLEVILNVASTDYSWIDGWFSYNYSVRKHGRSGYYEYYEDINQLPRYLDTRKSDVRPIIRLGMNLRTPARFGPPFLNWGDRFSLLGDIHLNVFFQRKRGQRFTWNPANYPDVEDNLRWKAYRRTDLRLSKLLYQKGNTRAIFYVDITNVFNTKNMLPFYYEIDITTDRRWAWDGHRWWHNQERHYMESLGFREETQSQDGSFNTSRTPGEVAGELPSFTPWTFLEKRDIYLGIHLIF